MKVITKTLTSLSLILLFSLTAFAKGDKKDGQNSQGDPINTKEEINEYIQHHVKDSHDFHLFSYFSGGEEHHVGFPLPVILWGENGLTAFMSSAFHHDDDGKEIVEKGGSNFVRLHGKIYELNAGATEVAFDEAHHPTNASMPIDLSITKSIFGILLLGFLMLLWFSKLAKQYKKKAIPTGFGRVLEPLVLYVRDEIAKPNIGPKYRKFTGYLMTVFFFIWLSNLLGLMPFGFNITGQLAVTAALAILTFVVYMASSNGHFWSHQLWMPGVPYILRPVLAVIELAGTLIIKPFSLAVRLFANITAGHIVVMSLIAIGITMQEQMGAVGSTLLSFVLSLFITLIEVLVAFLQAYIFTMLSALFIGMAVEEPEHH
ncbi:F0F1 ATP synthase subunit A [uncultured Dokdonia sp.]|uniref:F0F1 ATP synthase subunit A n=1 Tax=uncultured Dokdonia sp. TaxID=575653 RepID=UPI00262835AE|nr:F0F1 ATP synthase subunit A [uncultured Dokdonia sp.]